MDNNRITALAFLAPTLAIGIALSQTANAGFKLPHGPKCDVTVVGTNSSSADAEALNLAVAGPHDASEVRVCLLGRFQLGSEEFVSFNPQHVNEPAESVQQLEFVGLHGATIAGGVQPLRMPPASALPRLTIKNIRLTESLGTAVSIFRGNERIEISGLEIDGVVTHYFPDLDRKLREGIVLSTSAAEIGGRVVIDSNSLDAGAYDNVVDLDVVNAGIGVFGAFEPLNPYALTAVVTVSRNRLRNWSGSAISALNADSAIIWRNTIVSGTFGDLVPGGNCARATGLGSAAGISLAGVTNTLVMSNDITLQPATDGNSDTPCTVGIILVGDLAGVLSIPDSTGNVVTANAIAGNGSYALLVGRQSTAAEEDNFYFVNRLRSFAPTGASLIIGLGANGNTFFGHFPTVDGNVAGNTIIDFGL